MVVYEAGTDAEAWLYRDFLCEQGLNAEVFSGDTQALPGLTNRVAQVIVPSEEADRARHMLSTYMDAATPPDAPADDRANYSGMGQTQPAEKPPST